VRAEFYRIMEPSTYAALDDAVLYAHLYRHQSDRMTVVQLHLPTMHCASCVKAVETWPSVEPGLIDVRVEFSQKKARLRFNPQETTLSHLAERLDFMGYAPDLSMASAQAEEGPRRDRRATLELGVAGFVFGNTMLFAFPEYMGLDADSGLAAMMRYITAALSVPLVGFSAQTYFKSAWAALKSRTTNMDVPISLGIVALTGQSWFEMLSGHGAGYFDSLAGLVFFLLVGRWFQTSAYTHLNFDRDYQSFFPFSALRISGGTEVYVALSEVQVGDVLRIRHGELIPVDSVVVAGESEVDLSFITGEAQPQRVDVGSDVAAGAKNVGGALDVRVLKRLDQSYLTSLWSSEHGIDRPKVARWIDRLGQMFTGRILMLALAAGLFWAWYDASQVVWIVTSVLIVACPCALALAIPFSLGHTIRLMGRYGAFVKATDTLERLAKVDFWVLDKTGTLTEPAQQTWTESTPIPSALQPALAAMVRQSAHPVSRSLTAHWSAVTAAEGLRVTEHLGQGLESEWDGGVLRLGSASFTGVAQGEVPRGVSWRWDGTESVEGWLQPVSVFRPGLPQGLGALKPDGMALLTGDEDRERAQLEELLPECTELRFAQRPHDKLQFVKDRQAEGRTVAMVGDGLNDAGALAQSDVGISIAEDALHFAPACDVLLQGSALPQLERMREMARQGMRAVRWNIGLSLVYNVVGLSFAVQGLLTPLTSAILMPISSLSVVGLSFWMTERAARRVFGKVG
jgi:Cu+-exporting ATPase